MNSKRRAIINSGKTLMAQEPTERFFDEVY